MDIGSLLTAHWQELLDLRAEFLGYALTTERADREKLEQAIAGLYSLASFDPPQRIVWFDSPVDAVLAGALWIEMLIPTMSVSQTKPASSFLLSKQLYEHISRLDNYVPPDYKKLAKALQDPMLITTTGIVPDHRVFGYPPLGPNVLEEHPMYSYFAGGLEWTVRTAVVDEVHQRSHNWKEALLTPWNAVREFLPFHQESLQSLAERLSTLDSPMQGKVLRSGKVLSALTQRIASLIFPTNHFSPLHDTCIAASRYVLRLFGIDLTDKLPMPHLLEAVKAGGWWWPFQDICFASDNPKELHFEVKVNSRRLHNENDMAIRFQDDWGFYVLHGVKVPEFVIQNRYSVKDIDTEPNMVIRSVMIERLGTAKYIMETGAEEIDRSDYGILYRKEHPNAPERNDALIRFYEPIHVVRMTNKTSEADGSFREYFLRVPPNIKTAREAVAWTFNLEENKCEPREWSLFGPQT